MDYKYRFAGGRYLARKKYFAGVKYFAVGKCFARGKVLYLQRKLLVAVDVAWI